MSVWGERPAGGEPRGRHRRRRLWRICAVLGAVLATAGAIIALNSGGSTKLKGVGAAGPTSVLSPPAAPGSGVLRPAGRFRPDPAARALVGRLPLARLVAQLFLVGLPPAAGSGAELAGPGWGGLVFTRPDFQSDGAARSLLSAAVAALAGSGAPAPLLAADQPGGSASALPDLPPAGEAQIAASGGSPAAARSAARASGRALRKLGFRMVLAPLADTDTSGGPLTGLLYGSEPSIVGRFAIQALAGYRGARVIAAAGHFPGEGAASGDPDQMTATVGGTPAALAARDLVPFAAIAGRAPVIEMSNALYAALDGVTPASLLPAAVDLLRRRLGFTGVIMSGDLDAALLATGGGIGAAARAALLAGDDLLFLTGSRQEQLDAYRAVLNSAQGSAAVRRRIRESALRVLSLKARYGLLR